MDRASYDRYLSRFNHCDATAFDDYMTPDARMINGALEMRGIAAIQDHYANRIWPFFEETVHVERFVLDGSTLAARLWTHFAARRDADTIFGAVKRGEMFDYRGLVMYEIAGGRFARIDVSYLTFSRTNLDGRTTLLGLPH
ncbi:MAG: nuclear transport factor 2 family protein [Gammaproteobacteria bacterium]|nr:nuclear transport factor 2 family protein [Gammaproteobacteria bacterium]